MSTADVILHNGKIATVNPQQPEAQAVAIAGGRFVAVGTGAQVMKLRGPATRVIDLDSRRAIPGLNDSHLHVIRGGLNYNMELLGRRAQFVRSLAHAQGAGRRTPPPQWVRVVGGWTEFQFAERRMPTLEENQRRVQGHADICPPFVRSGTSEWRGTPGVRLHQRHARSPRRGDSTRQAWQPHRHAHCPAQCHDLVRHVGQGSETATGTTNQFNSPFHART